MAERVDFSLKVGDVHPEPIELPLQRTEMFARIRGIDLPLEINDVSAQSIELPL